MKDIKQQNIIKLLVSFSSLSSFVFGVWHFFVPGIWDWYNHMDSSASELILAVRAINFFFSLCLVLFGVLCVLFVFIKRISLISRVILLSTVSVLWASRIVMQIIYPQGSASVFIQYSMLAAFIVTFFGYFLPLIFLLIKGKNIKWKEDQ